MMGRHISLGTLPSDGTEKTRDGVPMVPRFCTGTRKNVAKVVGPFLFIYKRWLRPHKEALSPTRTLSQPKEQLLLVILTSL
jgi:hypothetical protein